jgi:hypothetical protein
VASKFWTRKGGILFEHESIPNIFGKTLVFPVRFLQVTEAEPVRTVTCLSEECAIWCNADRLIRECLGGITTQAGEHA